MGWSCVFCFYVVEIDYGVIFELLVDNWLVFEEFYNVYKIYGVDEVIWFVE